MFNFLKLLDKKQESAIDVNMSIAVSAGAGSGKTRVLTARILKLLEEGYNIDEIVAITFTEKASLEMKKRVRGALLDEINDGNEDLKVFLQNQLDRLSNCKITTIHSFCFNIIKENAVTLGMDFNLELLVGVDQDFKIKEIFNEEIEKLQVDERLYDVLLEISKGNPYDNNFIENLKQVRSAIYNNHHSIQEAFNLSNKDTINEAIFNLISNVDEKYKEYKSEHNYVDNDDLLIIAGRLLENDDIRESYRNRYKIFLVDEFQDTNEIQRKILYNLVSDKNNIIEPSKLFIVGDKKQGIYSFRGANCDIFNKVTTEISSLDKASGKKILLDKCYRSKENIVRGINEIFSVSIDDYEPLQFSKEEAPEDKNLKRIIYLTSEEEANENPLKNAANVVINEENTDMVQGQLQFIRENINKNSQNKSKSYSIDEAVSLLTSKGYKYEDICILVRTSNSIEPIENELKKINVPYCIIGGRNFYKKEEIQLLINLYEIATRSYENMCEENDMQLIIKVLRSFAFNVPDDLIFKVINSKLDLPLETSFNNLIDLYIDGYKNNDEIAPLVLAIDKLKEISNLGEKYATYMLLNKIVEALDLYTSVLALQDGAQKYRNIEKLIDETCKFDNKDLYDNGEFLKYLRHVEEGDKDTADATLDTEDSKAVKIMTVHMSKGLEFKTVIFPDVDYKLVKVQNKPIVVYHNENIVIKEDIASRKDIDMLSYSNYDADNRNASIEEEIRVLYVAMTRAEEYFVFTGKGPAISKRNGPDYNEILQKSVDKNDNVQKYFELIPRSEISVINNTESKEEHKINYDGIIHQLSYQAVTNNKKTISASAYMSYKKCPRKYYFEKVLNLDGSYLPQEKDELSDEVINIFEEDNTELKGAALGSIVHEVLESFNGKLIDVNEVEDLKVRRYIENFNSIEKRNKEEKTDAGLSLVFSVNEIPFTYALLSNKDITITGFIDRLDLYEKDCKLIAEVIDYKTNKIFKEEDFGGMVEHYEPQLLLYGKVVQELLSADNRNVDVIIPRLYLLDNGTTMEFEYDDGAVKELFEEMNKVFARDFSESDIEHFGKVEGIGCNYCGYCSICK